MINIPIIGVKIKEDNNININLNIDYIMKLNTSACKKLKIKTAKQDYINEGVYVRQHFVK